MTATDRRIFEPDGRAVPYVDEGEGPAIVLIPGRGLDFDYLETLASVLVEEDFRVLSVGARRAPTTSLHDAAQDVVDVMDAVGIASAWLGGQGYGGAVARTVALDHHDHANGVLLLGVENGTIDDEAVATAVETVLSGGDPDAAVAALPHLIGPNADAQLAWNIVQRSLEPHLAAPQRDALSATATEEWAAVADGVPMLIIQGADDTVTPPSNGAALQASAPGLVTIVTLDGAGHLFAATHPGETSWIIEDYLDWD